MKRKAHLTWHVGKFVALKEKIIRGARALKDSAGALTDLQ